MTIRKLTDPTIEEVSLVDRGANLRTFFFVKNLSKNQENDTPVPYDFSKANADIKIESNGTVEGTTIKINDKVIDPTDFSFSLYSYDWEKDVYCSYVLEDTAEKGEFSTTRRYVLQKSTPNDTDDTEKTKKTENLKKSVSTIQDVIKEAKLDHMGEDEIADLAKSLDVLADYKDLVPPEASEAIDVLTKMAVKKSEQQDENKETEIKKEENEMKEEKTEETEKTEVNTEESPKEKEEATEALDNKGESKVDTEVVVMEKEDLNNLVASITEKVTTSIKSELSTLLEEKIKDEGEEIVDIDLNEILSMVDEKLNE